MIPVANIIVGDFAFKRLPSGVFTTQISDNGYYLKATGAAPPQPFQL